MGFKGLKGRPAPTSQCEEKHMDKNVLWHLSIKPKDGQTHRPASVRRNGFPGLRGQHKNLSRDIKPHIAYVRYRKCARD